MYTYLIGDEYEDIAAAWDWSLIPGITVDYGATPLACSTTQQTGVQAFVGGVSDGKIGAAVMTYTNPLTESLSFRKAWFFLEDDVQLVMIPTVSSTSNASVFSVLDQKRANGPLIIDGNQSESIAGGKITTLWHANVGYDLSRLDKSTTLSAQIAEKTGNWSIIGISTQPPVTVDLFTAYLQHGNLSTPVSYAVFPGITRELFEQKCSQSQDNLHVLQNNAIASAVLDRTNQVAMFVFWQATGGAVTFKPGPDLAPITVTVTESLAVVYRIQSGQVIVSDPSQTLTSAQVTVAVGPGRELTKWGSSPASKTITFQLPSGGVIGSSVTQSLY